MLRIRIYAGVIFITGLFIFLLSSANIFAQDDSKSNKNMSDDDIKTMIEKRASDLTHDLTSKLDLSNDQANLIKNVLVAYQTKVSDLQTKQRAGLKEYNMPDSSGITGMNNPSDDFKIADDDATSHIESVLTDSQKAKWTDVKDSWLAQVKSFVYGESPISK